MVRNESSTKGGCLKHNQDEAMLKLLLRTTMPDADRAATMGHKAFLEGKQLGDNPFDLGTKEFQVWEDNWWNSFYDPEVTIVTDFA